METTRIKSTEQRKFEEKLCLDPELGERFMNAFVADDSAEGSYFEWCWAHKEEVRE